MAEFAVRIPDQQDYHRFLFDYAMHDSKPTNCYISFEKFVVESNGDIRPCHIFRSSGTSSRRHCATSGSARDTTICGIR